MADLAQLLVGQSDDLYTELQKEFLANRILIFNDEVNENVVEDYILYIIKWNMEDKNLPIENRQKITLVNNSPGGSAFDGWGLVSVILQSKTPVVGVSLGLVASMGYHIYLACGERYALKNSIFLMHDGETIVQNSSSKAKQTMAFFENMEKRTKEYVLSRTIIDSEFYDSVYEQEFWFYADKAKELGVVHKIVGEDCELDEIF